MIDNNTNQPSNIDPKILKKQERKKMFAQLAKQREEQRQFKIAERQKLREQFIKYKGEINKLETKCKNDIEAKWLDFRGQVKAKMLSQKDAKSQFKKYHKERINQFRTEEQEYRHLNTEILKQKFSFRFRRWFFGIGKEFSRITWVGGRQIIKDFGIIILLIIIMALIFLGLDALFTYIPKG